MTFRRLIAGLCLAGLVLVASPAVARDGALANAMQSVVSVLPEWPPNATRTEEPEGSGVVVLDGRHIITALHVVDIALSVNVRTLAGEVIAAEVVGRDQATDLALLRLAEPLPALEFAGDPAIGDEVCAIGNAFGLGLSVSCGVVAAINKAGIGFNPIEDFIQTDAAVNPGASGGALVTRDGQLVGVLSAIFTKRSDANIGVNFAVSPRLAERVARGLQTDGRVRWIAAGMKLVDALETGETGTLGAEVERVRPGSPAETAGMEVGDIVIRAANRRIRKPADFVSAMARMSPPAELEIEFLRDGTSSITTLALSAR